MNTRKGRTRVRHGRSKLCEPDLVERRGKHVQGVPRRRQPLPNPLVELRRLSEQVRLPPLAVLRAGRVWTGGCLRLLCTLRERSLSACVPDMISVEQVRSSSQNVFDSIEPPFWQSRVYHRDWVCLISVHEYYERKNW